MAKRKDGRYRSSITIDGKRVYFYGKTQAEVNRKIREYQEEKGAGRKFSVVCDEWEEAHFKTIQPGTQYCYRPAIKRALKAFGDELIEDIKAIDLQRHIGKMGAQGFSAQTVRVQIAVFNMIFRHAIIAGDIEVNPVDAVRSPRNLPSKRREMPTEEQLQIVKDSVDKPFGLFAFLLLYTGCRRGEALALRYEDIDRGNRIITINKAVSYANGKMVVKHNTKTEAGMREVYLLKPLADKLPNAQGYIFGGRRPLADSTVRKKWKDYCTDAGLIGVTPHQLRHAYATILFEAGIDEKSAQQFLGHADIGTTKNIYTHIRAKKIQDAGNKLDEYLKS
jgi:integrase